MQNSVFQKLCRVRKGCNMENRKVLKKDKVKLQINGLTHAGEGVGRYSGMAVFVPGTVPGDTVLVAALTTACFWFIPQRFSAFFVITVQTWLASAIIFSPSSNPTSWHLCPIKISQVLFILTGLPSLPNT